jgi:hypothetical protein
MTEPDVAVALGMSIAEYLVRYERGMIFTPSTGARPRCHQWKSLFPFGFLDSECPARV